MYFLICHVLVFGTGSLLACVQPLAAPQGDEFSPSMRNAADSHSSSLAPTNSLVHRLLKISLRSRNRVLGHQGNRSVRTIHSLHLIS